MPAVAEADHGTVGWVAALDETVRGDRELLDWFGASSWWDLSIALSMAMQANVEFPGREDRPPTDSDAGLEVMVYDTVIWIDYPVAVSQLLQEVLATRDEEECVQSWEALARQVRTVEGIPIRIGRKPFAPWTDDRDVMAAHYAYTRPAPGTWTLAKWRDTRLAPHLPSHSAVTVNRPDGSSAPGQTLLSALRRLWSQAPTSTSSGTDDGCRLFEVMRESRWTSYVLTACAGDDDERAT